MVSLSAFSLTCGLLVLLCSGLAALAASDVFETVLGSTASCRGSCEMTYSLHTYPRVSVGTAARSERLAMVAVWGGPPPLSAPGNRSGVRPQEEELYACRRGCRLFSICQFVRDGGDLNRTKSECEASKTSRTSAAPRARCIQPGSPEKVMSLNASADPQPARRPTASPRSSLPAAWAARTSFRSQSRGTSR